MTAPTSDTLSLKKSKKNQKAYSLFIRCLLGVLRVSLEVLRRSSQVTVRGSTEVDGSNRKRSVGPTARA